MEILEPINVWVFFKGNLIEPYLFFWRGRQIKVDKVNLIHTSKNGASLFYHFSISGGGNFYKLRFDNHNLKWFLEGVEEE
ncbi:hypothetical protein A3A14_00255 [Candidatus Daviesbacteria bacterium RIFCSPLOWO2_01_FULL_43_38]|uniref:Uncharacterized protein n=1 Tax=Candidatus Daviesbacteria bacterium RIFCSPHIGHO2_12_FULL_43_11 TaxID=1797780 RepID=A0A1F5K4P6_9BACT|nr:MAG: hypothetical protein A2874_00895 [Candidatus Daviesbacteria bacterium RIFCSPHIGHO2_01_FULL_43_17]OGE35774.1 MAG: hypothetical protein A3E45_00580 [Candidatus Daviesbacteria bacterium RIFCSPHIGHO2_12_FULL_43_11]OGE63459.1 MAG: hypothetical protein A3A14_00255 [Candidatus Daviesbacteria bacterium RIFCSPLOWO2_01_FULL_43_38]OGE69685.1 MAG: hypothetical protein A3J21_03285 [Candidatus Daviesbacteria bacterium RIFCSPLOWO2_02_FULL_43_11]